jgi:hypothetical protein
VEVAVPRVWEKEILRGNSREVAWMAFGRIISIKCLHIFFLYSLLL